MTSGDFNIFPPDDPYPKKHWTEIQREMETRPAWGRYYDDLFPLEDYENWYDRPIVGWMSFGISFKTPIDEVQELTEWLKENIDNVWEGPIGYMGGWKFRFTTEADYIAFKLFVS